MYQYKLSSNKLPKKDCPKCNHSKKWQRYFNPADADVLPDEFGKCDRADSCGYECNPYKTGYFKGTSMQYKTPSLPIKVLPKYYIPIDALQATLKEYESNHFIQYLINKFGIEKVQIAIENYLVGTIENFTCFPYIDMHGKINIITMIQYDENCKRKKDIRQTNLHSYLKYKKYSHQWLINYCANESYHNCFFGEHLVQGNQTSIAIVEAPKTAFIMSILYPHIIWIASGALLYLTPALLRKLRGRNVTFYPDASTNDKAYNIWSEKAKPFGYAVRMLDISDELKAQGCDLADFALALPPIKPTTELIPTPEDIPPQVEVLPITEPLPILEVPFAFPIESYTIETIPTCSNADIHTQNATNILELQNFFATYKNLQSDIVYLGAGHTITDIHKFVNSHFARIETYYHHPKLIAPYLNRLNKVKEILLN
jgi:hypothetical protein